MHPELIPGWPIHSYGVMLVVAFYAAYFLVRWTGKREGIDPNQMVDILLVAAVLGIAGSRAFYVIQYWDRIHSFWQVFAIWRGGLVFYGGLLGAVLGLSLYLARKKIPIWKFADAAAPAIMIGLGFGRIGCFLNGCCWGAVADERFPFAVRFPRFTTTEVVQVDEAVQPGRWYATVVSDEGAEVRPATEVAARLKRDPGWRRRADFQWWREDETPDGRRTRTVITGSPAFLQHLEMYPDRITCDSVRSLPVYPTQLFSSLSGFTIAAVLLLWRRWRRRPGELFALLGVLYAVARFLIEFVRNDTDPVLGPLTISQTVSIPVFVVAAAAFIACRVAPAKLDNAPAGP